jgi:hypothetical protein
VRVARRFIVAVLLLLAMHTAAERINQEGGILGVLPVVTNAVLFNTTNADAVLSAMQILPVTNPWNEIISNRPVLTNSEAMVAQIGADLSASRQKLFFEVIQTTGPNEGPRSPGALTVNAGPDQVLPIARVVSFGCRDIERVAPVFIWMLVTAIVVPVDAQQVYTPPPDPSPICLNSGIDTRKAAR